MPHREQEWVAPPRESVFADTDSLVDEPATALYTTAGDLEREVFSRRANALEALVVIMTLLGAAWGVGYYLGILRGMDVANTASQFILVFGVVYMLVIAPVLHRDQVVSRGLGSPAMSVSLLSAGPVWRRVILALMMIAIFWGICGLTYVYWPNIVARAGFRETLLFDLHRAYPGRFVVFGIGGLAAAGVVLFAVRYDNFFPAFRAALTIILPLLVLMLAIAWLLHGAHAFAGLQPRAWAESVLRQVCLGFALELVFSAYFGTRLRKAFGPPAIAPRRPPIRRWLLKAALIGMNLAIVVYLASLFGLRLSHGVERIPLSIPLTIAAVFLPIGFAYGLIYCVSRERLLVATLVASIYAAMHMDSYFLAAGAGLMGISIAYVFMQDRNRNLAAVAMVHGALGSTFRELFGSGRFGQLDVRTAIGPQNIEYPTPEILVVPCLWVAAYGCIALWCWRNLSAEEPSETV